MNEFAQFILERFRSGLLLLLLATPLLTGVLIGVHVVMKKKNKRLPWKKLLLWGAVVLYLLFLVFVTLLRGMGGYRSVNLHLFRAWREAWNHYSVKNWLNVLLNVAMFVPFGFLLPLTSNKLKKWYFTVGSGFCLSLIIELLQLCRATGVCDVDDLLANTLGTVIGYAAMILVLAIVSKKDWKQIAACALTLVLILGGISGIFIAYDLKAYGNIPEAAVFRANTGKTEWSLLCQLPQEKDTVPVYRTKTMTKKECDAFGASFASNFGLEFREIMYYDKETYFIDRGGDNGSHFLFVSYLDGSYDYSMIEREEQTWIDADRETVTAALAQYPLQIPNDAVFSVDGDGWHSFTADCLISGDAMFDGVIRCRFADDGKVYRIENNLIAYTVYAQTDVISPEEAFNKLCLGYFSDGEYFEQHNPEMVQIISVTLDYRIDTKGFYRPVYLFELASADGTFRSTVMVEAD